METLRFITCGSVDDGKSTLIGRLLYDSKQIFDDQISSLEKDSIRYGTRGKDLDLALLVDGLQAEREQGITIDVAYRFFATPARRFVVADTPGHEQYTRNMATGASTADLAVLLVDARKGLLTQTLRHSRIVAMLGVKHVVLAVNKMDLVNWDESLFSEIAGDYSGIAGELGFASIMAIPLSALEGDNVTRRGMHSPWYSGPSLLEYLENIDVSDSDEVQPFRMPVQWVNRPDPDFRGYCGRIASGRAKPGERVRIAGVETRIKSIVVWQNELGEASKGDSVTLCLENEVDVGRGDVIASALDPVELSDQFEARLICLSGHLVPGRSYILRMHTLEAGVTITSIKHVLDVNTGKHLAAKKLAMNDIGVVNISTSRPLAFEPYDRNKILGSFILIDRASFETLGAGMIDFALRRAANVHWQSLSVDRAARAGLKHQKPRCFWLTGLSGSGKSTIANLLEKRLFSTGRHTYILDGDNVRHGLNRDLGFTEADRVENIRRVAEVSRLMVDAGLMVIVSFLSPFRSERDFARSLFPEEEFIEIFVDAPFEECEKRDTKGLYAKARRGELKNFTGLDSPYEPPEYPEIRLDTLNMSPEDCVAKVLDFIGGDLD